MLQRAYRDYECEQRMRDLIAEEEAEGRLLGERAAARAAADKEKKAKKRERARAKKVGMGGDSAVSTASDPAVVFMSCVCVVVQGWQMRAGAAGVQELQGSASDNTNLRMLCC